MHKPIGGDRVIRPGSGQDGDHVSWLKKQGRIKKSFPTEIRLKAGLCGRLASSETHSLPTL